jgi:hypothetical protein
MNKPLDFVARMTREQRDHFWSCLHNGGPDDCWPYIGARAGTYAKHGCMIDGRTYRVLAHRLAYRLTTYCDPGDLCVLHSCDNPPCCNPAHLSDGTHQDNSDDKFARGRGKNGPHDKVKVAAAARLIAMGRSVPFVAHELNLCESVIRRWVPCRRRPTVATIPTKGRPRAWTLDLLPLDDAAE